MTQSQQTPSAVPANLPDPALELEARANLVTALWANLRYDVATKDRQLSQQQERCETLERELAAVREEMRRRTDELEREYTRLWNSRSRLLKRGLRLTFGLERRKP